MSDLPIRVPTTRGDVTIGWLESVLEPGTSVLSGMGETIGAGFGLASDIVRYPIRSPSGETSVIVKLWSTEPPDDVTEVRFYRHLAPRLGIRVPRCHFAAVDPAIGRAVLVLEDLAPLEQGDALTRLGRVRSERLAETVAMLHAAWWEEPALVDEEWLEEAPLGRSRAWLSSRKAEYLDRFGAPDDRLLAAVLRDVETVNELATQRLGGAWWSLIHGELHLDQIVFVAGDEPVILDWARCRRGPVASDLAQVAFEIGPLDAANAVIDSYQAGLAGAGVTVDAARIRSELGGALLAKAITDTLGIARWDPTTDRESALIDQAGPRLAAALRTWRRRDPPLFAELGWS